MKTAIRFFNMLLLLFVLGYSTPVRSQMIADISEPVETDFGTYRPYPAVFTPNVPSFTIEQDFSNIDNFSNFYGFTQTDLTLLMQNHFTVKKCDSTNMYDIYNNCTWNGTPIFVTTDAVLHTYHVLFDRILSDIEIREFVNKLDMLTEIMLDTAISFYEQAEKPETIEAAQRNIAFFSVARKLLKGEDVTVPESVAELVDAELDLIDQHDGFHYSPVFGTFSALDYSQFIPRGHYTQSELLESYFRAMMWYGWTIFTMEPGKFGDLARLHTLQALLLVQALYRIESEGLPLIDLWEYIYEPTVFFVGKTDDPSVVDYKALADQVYGSDFINLPSDSLANSALLDEFMTEAQKLSEPAIPNWIYDTFITYKGFRFMGQRFIPDSYMFAHLVLPEISGRYFPKGLDVMAILDSERAYELLDTFYNETTYGNYPQKITEFKTEFAAKSQFEWAQNLYWNWLYCLMPLLYTKGDGYPFFMQTEAWSDKELVTALASWAELRHDTILYAKQSMTPCCIGPGPPKSYVEPNPYLYARLASLVRYTREGLELRDLLQEEYADKLDLFETLLLFLRDVSIKELENVPLSDAEYENIFCFGKVMEDLVVIHEPEEPWKGDTDNMAVIADVHTDSNTDQCLEEGVGYPLEIFVIVKEGGVARLTKGAIFSYYEFTRPVAERLTDEAWREMLESAAPPVMPEWTANFMDITSPQPSLKFQSDGNLFNKEFTSVESDEEPVIPEPIILLNNYPNPFNPETTIQFILAEDARVSLTIYNLLGQKVITLTEGQKSAGLHTVVWDGRDESGHDVSSGVYIYSVRVKDMVQVKKMVLMR